jgi:peroxiredoxin (alkyl hydroperoxide reductase subunit C)
MKNIITQSSILIGKKAPSIKSKAVIINKIINNFSLDKYLNRKYVVLFFYPKDFTFVCPTELHALQKLINDFQLINTKIVACSTDTEYSHLNWLKIPFKKGGIKGITFPIISDINKSIAKSFHVLNDKGEFISFRGVFIIDKNGIIQYSSIQNFFIGRNIKEIIRIIHAIQFYEKNGKVCPANWKKGRAGIIPEEKKSLGYFNAQ